jgi:SNF2 family DNA or RNA helicase
MVDVDDGSMKPVDREAALTKIKTSETTKVILISFKAGSTGSFIARVGLSL